MGNLPASFFSLFTVLSYATDFKYFLSTMSVAQQFEATMLLNRSAEDKFRRLSLHIHSNMQFQAETRPWDLQPCHRRVSLHLKALNFCSSSLPCFPPLLQNKLEDLSHHPHFSSKLVGSKVASWVGAGSRWLHAQGDQAKALQVLTPPLPWVLGWGGSGLGNLPELSGMTSRLPLHHPLLCSHMAPAMGSFSWGSDLRKINCGRAREGKPHSLG